MPTYEYLCKQCGERLEVFQSFKEKPLKKHADCGGALEKVLHPRGVVFKGSGFYVTDSKSAKSSSPSKTSEPTTSSSKTPDSKSGETKGSAPKSATAAD
jgi:putative FmdB family regulatory protein